MSQTYTRRLSPVVTEILELKDSNYYSITTSSCLGDDTLKGKYLISQDTLVMNPQNSLFELRLMFYEIDYFESPSSFLIFLDQNNEPLVLWNLDIIKTTYQNEDCLKFFSTDWDGRIELTYQCFSLFAFFTPHFSANIILPLPLTYKDKAVKITYHINVPKEIDKKERRYLIRGKKLYYIDFEKNISDKYTWKKIGL